MVRKVLLGTIYTALVAIFGLARFPTGSWCSRSCSYGRAHLAID